MLNTQFIFAECSPIVRPMKQTEQFHLYLKMQLLLITACTRRDIITDKTDENDDFI